MRPAPVAPPRLAERTARLAAGSHAWDDSIGGDLREEFAAILAARGHGAARRWYYRQVFEILAERALLAARTGLSALSSFARPQGDPHMRSFLHELRPAIRSLIRQPLVTSVIVLTLAIGLGTNAAVAGMVDALILRPFPFQGVDELVMFAENSPENPYPQEEVAPANFAEWRREAKSFTAMAAFTPDDVNMAGAEEAERVGAATVSGEFFGVLGIRPAHGRLLGMDDELVGQHFQVVLSDGIWQRRFAGEAAVVGRTIRIDGRPFTVVGVAPAGFDFPNGADLWMPLGLDHEDWADRRSHYLTVIARLKPGVAFEQAAAELTSLYARQRQAWPDETRERSLVTRTFTGGMIDIGLVPILGLWQAAAFFVLLIGCANVANLLLARGTARRREMAVRAAIGASRGRLVRQLLVESLLLAIVSAPVALVVAAVTTGLVRGAMPQQLVRYVSGWMQMGVDLRVALVTVGLAALVSLLFGLLPALHSSRPELTGSLKDGGRSVTGSRQWLRRGLVVAQLALAMPLLVASGMSALGAQRFAGGPQGYEPEGLARLRLVLPDSDYPDAEARRLFARRLVEAARRIPGVEAAATTTVLPSSTTNQRREVVIDGQPVDPDRVPPSVNYRAVSPDYLRALRVPVLQGRGIEPTDREDTEPVAVISESMAARFWPDGNAIGSRIELTPGAPGWRTVVGIAGDTVDDWFSSRNVPTVFVPAEQAPSALVNLLLRTSGDPASLSAPARSAVAGVDATLAPFEVTTMTEAVRVRTTGIRFVGGIMAAFGIIALVLSAVGIYSVMAYFVAQRHHEIGIRMALGATARSVLVGTATGGGRMAAVGIAIGLVLGLLLARLIESALFGVVAIEPWLFAAIGGLLGAVALLASLIPARSAARTDPVTALRAE